MLKVIKRNWFSVGKRLMLLCYVVINIKYMLNNKNQKNKYNHQNHINNHSQSISSNNSKKKSPYFILSSIQKSSIMKNSKNKSHINLFKLISLKKIIINIKKIHQKLQRSKKETKGLRKSLIGLLKISKFLKKRLHLAKRKLPKMRTLKRFNLQLTLKNNKSQQPKQHFKHKISKKPLPEQTFIKHK